MANIVFYSLDSGFSSVDANSFATNSITPTTGRVVWLSVVSQGVSVSSVSGNGLTWTLAQTSVNTGLRITTYWGYAASPSAGAITVNLSGSSTSYNWSVTESDNTNTSSPVVQTATNTSAAAPSLTVTLASFSNSANATYGAFVHAAQESSTVGSGFTSLHTNGVGANPGGILTEYRTDNDTSVDASWAFSSISAGLAIEIKNSTPATSAFGVIFF